MELVLKALLIYHGRQPNRTHILEDLLHECERYEPMLATLLPDCVRLTPYVVATRCPDTGMHLDKEDARDALAAMRRVRIAVLALLPA